ncbi:hypothetical protein F5X96DRAFT_678109 [Biscogniauxia mediterranea]|nr:hypothetical protein F5X96DRAFT_678109 [Biscogniauxia mediterranea]
MTKSVCIIGAGPSGLVAAKNLQHHAAPGAAFRVTVYDAQPRVGGLWPTRRDDVSGLVHPLMLTNQSRHTVQFSDLAWRDADPQFPRAWQVGQYLERYVREHGIADVIRLGRRVVAAELLPDGSGAWEVRTEASPGGGAEETNVFDYLLVTSGFFGQPLWPEAIPREAGADIPIIHSSKYRDIEGLLSRGPTNGGGSKILVVGGQTSGIEIAGTIGTDLSSATHSPGEKIIPNPQKYTIHHVAHRPAWVFPLFTSPKPDSPAPPFLPCDLPSYNLDRRPKPLTNTQGHISVEAARIFNELFKSALGTDQSEFSPDTKIDGALLDEPPYLAMSQHYLDFVREGLIHVHRGRLTSLSSTTATVTSDGATQEISDIAAVVLATGFDPSPSLSFLPPAVLETLSHSPAVPDLPLALAFHGTHHPALPTLGFVGYYRSPYWGVMEMQARFVARLWGDSDSQLLRNALADDDDSIARALALREDKPRRSQFPMGDYPFLMDAFAQALGMRIEPLWDGDHAAATATATGGGKLDALTPSRYVPADASAQDRAHAERNLRALRETLGSGGEGTRFVAGAVFRSLLGTWRLSRSIRSRLPSHPSGRFEGTARFLLRRGTPDGRNRSRRGEDNDDDNKQQEGSDGKEKKEEEVEVEEEEYLYVEDGEFAADTGFRFRATRRYVWRYDPARDALSVWFARTGDGDDADRADYLFHEVEFLPPPPPPSSPTIAAAPAPGDRGGDSSRNGGGSSGSGSQGRGWQARASHLCVEDLYDVRYEFGFRGVNLGHWTLGYTVRGPKKDYTIDGVYRRE